jgi:large subunit ribosomal protein L18
MQKSNALRDRRKQRVRSRIRKQAKSRLRLSVYRSEKNIYAQVIDDVAGTTLVAASSVEKDLRGRLKSGATREAAVEVGKLVAQRAAAKGLAEVVFDRGGYMYHGRIKALADAAREGGLKF